MGHRALLCTLLFLVAVPCRATAAGSSPRRGRGISKQGLALRRLLAARRAAEAMQIAMLFEPSAKSR